MALTAIAGLLLTVIVWGAFRDNKPTSTITPPLPAPLPALRKRLDLSERWALYALDVPRRDGWVELALWDGERWWSPRSGEAPSVVRHASQKRA